MKLVALLNWYDESVMTLTDVMDDLQRLGVTAIIAAEGRYENFPDGRRYPQGIAATYLTERAAIDKIDLLLYSPRDPWQGDEVAKRQKMLELALAITTEEDWLVIFDADYSIISLPTFDWKALLDDLAGPACDVLFSSAAHPGDNAGWHPMRMFMRAVRGMRMGPNHYTYLLPDGSFSEILPREGSGAIVAPLMNSMKVHHWHVCRDETRHAQQTAYYEVRDGQGLEQPHA